MYRTATAHVYDVLDEVFVNVTITEYEKPSGDEVHSQFVWSATLPSEAQDDRRIWLWSALQRLQAELDLP